MRGRRRVRGRTRARRSRGARLEGEEAEGRSRGKGGRVGRAEVVAVGQTRPSGRSLHQRTTPAKPKSAVEGNSEGVFATSREARKGRHEADRVGEEGMVRLGDRMVGTGTDRAGTGRGRGILGRRQRREVEVVEGSPSSRREGREDRAREASPAWAAAELPKTVTVRETGPATVLAETVAVVGPPLGEASQSASSSPTPAAAAAARPDSAAAKDLLLAAHPGRTSRLRRSRAT